MENKEDSMFVSGRVAADVPARSSVRVVSVEKPSRTAERGLGLVLSATATAREALSGAKVGAGRWMSEEKVLAVEDGLDALVESAIREAYGLLGASPDRLGCAGEGVTL